MKIFIAVPAGKASMHLWNQAFKHIGTYARL
jgi:hypothetical protein